MAKIGTFFSSSSGNCTYISSGNEGILVDVGVSSKQILTAMEGSGIEKENIKGIFITHTHTDHIKGLKVLLKKINVPVYGSKETLGELILHGALIDGVNTYYDMEDSPKFDFNMQPEFFRTSHDCVGSGGYTVTLGSGEKVAVCTDLGVVTDDIRGKLSGAKAVVLESNHDVGMLQNSIYPFETKQRILGNEGHLSNVSCAAELPLLVKSGTTNIILAHLSRENNTPDLARVTAQSVLLESGMKDKSDYLLSVAPAVGTKMAYI
jgi:phosphoribosyl 1,2-cyclic phosphodiesterase